MYIFKKISFYIFLAASLLVAIWAYFNLKESKAPQVNIADHIPTNAVCVIETKDIQNLILNLTRQNLIWNSLLTEEKIANAQNGIHFLDSLTRTSSDLTEILDNNSIYWSFIKEGSGIENLVQFKLKEQKSSAKVETFFSAVFKKNSSITSFLLFDVNINHKKWHVTCFQGIIYFCSDLSLLQNCMELDKAHSLSGNKGYEDLLKINGKQNTQVYFNHNGFGLFNTDIFNGQSLFNLEVQLNELTFTGYTNPDNKSFLNKLSQQKEKEFHEFEKLPNNVASFTGISVNDAKLFYESNKTLLTQELNNKINIAWKALNDSALYNLKLEAYENISGEMISANYWLDNYAEQLMSLQINDEEKALQLLKFMSDSVIAVGEMATYKINAKYLNLFSFYGTTQEMLYGCLRDGNLIFMSSKNMLLHFAKSNDNMELLSKNNDFLKYANDNLFQASQYIYYENYDQIKYSNFTRLINSIELNTGNDVLSDLSLTIKSFKNSNQVRLHATHKQEQQSLETDKNILWSFVADSIIDNDIHVFKNHLTQENELCFQDDNNLLYLLSSTGKAIWKKQINEAVQSTIFTVDIFKNGKFQLLFNTQNYLHLIDRNGNYVQGYPIKLPQKITSAITLLDYDNTKDYRIFVACADKRIYNFSLYGIKTEGFKPIKTENEVTLPIFYNKVGASDYLITADVSGKIYGFSRKGEGRIDFKNKVIEGLSHLYISGGNTLDNTKIIYVDDKNNLLNKISLSDKKEALKLGDDVNGFSTLFALVNEDKQMDVVVYGNGALYSYDLFSGKIFESFNDQAVYETADVVNLDNKRIMIVFDKAAEKVDVIDVTGKISYSVLKVSHKPLVTEMYNDGKKYIVTVNHNKLNCRRLN